MSQILREKKSKEYSHTRYIGTPTFTQRQIIIICMIYLFIVIDKTNI